MSAELPTRVVYEVKCTVCPGDGVVRPNRPGVDWPSACSCQARKQLTNYQLGRILEESPRSILAVDRLRAKPTVAARIIEKFGFGKLFPFWRSDELERTSDTSTIPSEPK